MPKIGPWSANIFSGTFLGIPIKGNPRVSAVIEFQYELSEMGALSRLTCQVKTLDTVDPISAVAAFNSAFNSVATITSAFYAA